MPPKRKAAASEKTSTRAEGGTNGNVVSSEATTAVTPTKRSRRGSDVSSEKLSESPPNIQETKQQPKRGRGRPVKARPKNKNNGETTSGRLNESGEKMDYEVSPQSPGSSSEEVASEKSNSPGKTKINESNKGEEKQQLKSEPMETDEDGDNKSEAQQTEERAQKNSEEIIKQQKTKSTEAEKLAKEQPQDKLKMLQTQEKPAELVAENTVPVSSGDIKEHQKQEKSDGGDTSRAKSDEQRQQEEKSTANQKSEDTDNKKFSNEQKKMDFIHDMPSNVLEKGHISFFYRPKIAAMHPNNPNEVQRLYIMLIPTLIRPTLGDKPIETVAQKMVKGKKTDEKEEGKLIGKPRLLIVGKKKLPEVENHARYWTFVDKSFDNLDDIKSTLGMEHYSTKTRGERTLQPCRPLGRGAYSILEHNKHTHLAYVLELPSQPGEVQSAFNIKHEASYIITVKNPEASNPPSAGLTSNKKSSYPPELMAKFEGRRFAPLYTTEFLDYEDSELILVGTKEDIKGELGAPGEYLENWADDEAKEIQLLEDRAIFEELHLEPKDFPHETLKGIWE